MHTAIRSLIVITALLVIGMGMGIYWHTRQVNGQLERAVKCGRISTPVGIYYLSPAPTLEEYEQLKADMAWLNKRLNQKKR